MVKNPFDIGIKPVKIPSINAPLYPQPSNGKRTLGTRDKQNMREQNISVKFAVAK